MMFIRLGLLTRKVSGMKQCVFRKGVSRKNNIISIVYENSFLLIHLFPKRDYMVILHISSC